jgi:hypothetical protein
MENKKEEKSHNCKSCKNCNCANSLFMKEKDSVLLNSSKNSDRIEDINIKINENSNTFKSIENVNLY